MQKVGRSGEGPALQALDDKVPGGSERLILVGEAGLGPTLSQPDQL